MVDKRHEEGDVEERVRRGSRFAEGGSLFTAREPVAVVRPAVGEHPVTVAVSAVLIQGRTLFARLASATRYVRYAFGRAASAVLWSTGQALAIIASAPRRLWRAIVAGPTLLRNQVRRRPGLTLGLALGLGFALGFVLRRTLFARR